MSNKIKSFEYTVIQLQKWKESTRNKDTEVLQSNSINRLKALYLVFLMTAKNSSTGGENFLIKNIFDNFHAQPYGPLEQDIFDYMKNGSQFQSIEINDNSTIVINEFVEGLDIKVKIEIDKAIEDLRRVNSDLINIPTFELGDLCRTYYSWRKTYQEAKEVETLRKKIDNDIIIKEDKTFSLNLFYKN